MIWSQSLRGRAIDMVNPTPDAVDFREIADTLATINRYNGAAEPAVSVAIHTLIACDAADEPLKPWVLLHDAHEAYIGDITTPTAEALAAVASEAGRELGFRIDETEAEFLISHTIHRLKTRHDLAIHAAAGLPLPNSDQRAKIRWADLVALRTERRDFLATPPMPWNRAIEDVEPLRKVYRWRAPLIVADALYERFRQYLPALADTPNRAA